MTNRIPNRRRPHPSEEGYILVMVMFMLAILVISMSIAVPIVRKEIQRDRDLETMQRGKQYVRAIKMYYKKFGTYPPNIDALVKTNEIRFLRKKYIDPTTGKDEWKLIHIGQNKTQTLGFFGQPIGLSAIAGTGPTGGNGLTPAPGSTTSPPGNQPPQAGPPGSPTAPTDGTDPNAPAGDANGTGLTGQTFGGGGIIGVSPGSPKQSILVYKKKDHYNEWEFFYDPIAEQMMMQGGNAAPTGLPTGTPGAASGFVAPTPTPTPTPSPNPPLPPQQ